MGWRSKSKVRRNAQKKGYRSGFELKVSEQLNEAKIAFGYEDTVIPYVKPATKHKYTIDFRLPNGILIEAKGRWTLEDRKKHYEHAMEVLGGHWEPSKIVYETVRLGSRGPTVRAVQEELEIGADGIFGRGTEAHVKAWQEENGLLADGIMGPKSLAMLFGED